MTNLKDKPMLYRLVGRLAVPCNDPVEWANSLTIGTRVDRTEVSGYIVSTVFLGLDHNFFGGRPWLFETMISIATDQGGIVHMERCETWDGAEKMHARAIKIVGKFLKGSYQ